MSIRQYRWSSKSEADRFSVENPATGETICIIQGGGESEVDQAVTAADAAYRTDWRWRPAMERGMLLQLAARKVAEHADEVAQIESLENGKPVVQARGDVDACVGVLSFFGSLAGKIPGDFYDGGLVHGAALLEPYGVVGGIIPFNWPPIHTAGKIAPALAMGNTVVVKPPEQTPLTVLRIVELIQSVLPPDVVHAVPGYGPSTGSALARHKLVRKISFTGATRTGAAVVKAAAGNTTPTLLELGGKNAMILMEDADIDNALKALVEAAFFNQGEACTAGSRILVHRSIHDTVAARLGEAIKRLKVGSGQDPATHVGPLVTKAHQQRVLEYIKLAQTEGAKVAAQAPLPSDRALAGGYFVAPTLLTGVNRNMRVATEEIFGPVVAIIPFNDEKEAISIANDTDYGLTCAIFSKDQARALRMARQIDVGLAFINNYFRRVAGMPFGGTKGSGYGREHCLETLKEFGRVKVMVTPSGMGEIPFWPAVAEVGL